MNKTRFIERVKTYGAQRKHWSDSDLLEMDDYIKSNPDESQKILKKERMLDQFLAHFPNITPDPLLENSLKFQARKILEQTENTGISSVKNKSSKIPFMRFQNRKTFLLSFITSLCLLIGILSGMQCQYLYNQEQWELAYYSLAYDPLDFTENKQD